MTRKVNIAVSSFSRHRPTVESMDELSSCPSARGEQNVQPTPSARIGMSLSSNDRGWDSDHAAAVRIQSVFRGRQGRETAGMTRKVNNAVSSFSRHQPTVESMDE